MRVCDVNMKENKKNKSITSINSYDEYFKVVFSLLYHISYRINIDFYLTFDFAHRITDVALNYVQNRAMNVSEDVM